uniref:MAM domain-containing protein n=1 Tax=Timema poppense TaxID=170557 RepID=A0A7R9H4K5_TIMPO|nr:unnamed protein product [Timema poppensis]
MGRCYVLVVTSVTMLCPSCDLSGYSAPELACDFESEDLCGWTQDPHHDFDWRRQSGPTPSGHVGTGPSYDHTLGSGLSGHYMYIESSSPRLENDTARLFSPVFGAHDSQDACFSLWYHMYGATTGYLRVYVKPEGVDLRRLTPSFKKYGEHGNQWLRGFFDIDRLDTPFQVNYL